ncbi:MAG: cyclic pyranopterin monophosphate synthase MoaC [Methanomassiliicoccales archaeon]|jgi:cyclic pyranopterin phosphate synthase|nr:cyclic pyranopterin monophosphate synthase MoaC [Methanomassiliicoccales archaeon]
MGGGKEMNGMVDISGKPIVKRKAIASGRIILGKKSLDAIEAGRVKKGNVFEAAKISAIQSVKATWQIIPYCHPIPIESVSVNFDLRDDSVFCSVEVAASYKTGVEMEALVGVTSSLLTIWDMVKYLEKDERGEYPITRITDIQVVSKEKEE